VKEFYVADLSAQGELQQVTEYDYAALEQIPGALDVISRCSAEIWKTPAELEAPLSDLKRTHLRWRSTASTAGIVTVRRSDGELVSVSLLAAGQNPAADATTLDAFQKHLVRQLRKTEFEPAFDLVHIKQRPLVATMTLASNCDGSEQMIEALADRCFAAAYFRYLGLA
jgi:hypothetical protein